MAVSNQAHGCINTTPSWCRVLPSYPKRLSPSAANPLPQAPNLNTYWAAFYLSSFDFSRISRKWNQRVFCICLLLLSIICLMASYLFPFPGCYGQSSYEHFCTIPMVSVCLTFQGTAELCQSGYPMLCSFPQQTESVRIILHPHQHSLLPVTSFILAIILYLYSAYLWFHFAFPW